MSDTPISPQQSGQLRPSFRLAEQSDIETLVELMRQFNALDAYPFDGQITHTSLKHFINNPALGRLWLILEGEAIIGYLALTFGYSFEFHGRDAFIDEIYLLPSHQGRGIGRQAMEFAIAACPDLGVHALHLEVEPHNTAALRLYQQVGFQDHQRQLMTRWIDQGDQ